MKIISAVAGLFSAVVSVNGNYVSELLVPESLEPREVVISPRPHTYVGDVPASFDWRNVDGVNFLTKNLNQHIPTYCGSCWAHGTLSSLADRIKIARKGKGIDINLSIQYILNCGQGVAGSCHGGSSHGVWAFIEKSGFVPYDTCLQYAACSSDSTDPRCLNQDYTCSAINTCRTCWVTHHDFSNGTKSSGSQCRSVDIFPKATIGEYGNLTSDMKEIQAEIYARGPIACSVNASPIGNYTGGQVDMPNEDKETNHVISIVGWTKENDGSTSWIVRNSWGEFWGEMGFFRIKAGSNILGIESGCTWATPGTFTDINTPCYEDASNCMKEHTYVDPHKHFGKKGNM